MFDITSDVEKYVTASRIRTGIVNVCAQGATAGIMLQENWDDSHLKAGIVGPSETIPVIDGKIWLSTWQNIFFCEFDGLREVRSIVVTVIAVD